MKTEEETRVTKDAPQDTKEDVKGEPEVTVDSLTEEITRLTAEIEKSNKSAEKAQSDAKSHQKAALEAGKWKSKIDGIEAQIGVLAEIIEERQPETDGFEQPKPRVTFQERLKEKTKTQPDPKKVETDAHRTSIAQEIMSLTDAKGKPFDKTPEFDRAYTKFMLGDADTALELVKEITEKMTEVKETKESEDERIERLVTERVKAKLKSEGELKSETGSPSGASLGDMEAIEKYNHGEMEFSELPESAKKRIKY